MIFYCLSILFVWWQLQVFVFSLVLYAEIFDLKNERPVDMSPRLLVACIYDV